MEMRKYIKFWLENLKGRNHSEYRRKWEDNIKKARREIGFGDMDWIQLTPDSDQWGAVVNTVMNLRVP
jgi:hypothetical protein